ATTRRTSSAATRTSRRRADPGGPAGPSGLTLYGGLFAADGGLGLGAHRRADHLVRLERLAREEQHEERRQRGRANADVERSCDRVRERLVDRLDDRIDEWLDRGLVLGWRGGKDLRAERTRAGQVQRARAAGLEAVDDLLRDAVRPEPGRDL